MITVKADTTLVDIKGLAKKVPVSTRRLQTMYRDEGMPCIRIGARVLFDVADVIGWLKERDESAS